MNKLMEFIHINIKDNNKSNGNFSILSFSKSSKKMSMKTAINICKKYREVRRFQLELQAFWAGRKPIYFVDC